MLPGMLYSTQCVKPYMIGVTSGASGSWHTRANAFVPAGASVHASAGDTSSASPVCFFGMRPSGLNAGLVSCIDDGAKPMTVLLR